MVRKWQQFYSKTIVKAATVHRLKKRIQEYEQRNWKQISAIEPHYNGLWCCVMELQPRQ